nr:hypothetical protein CFP56_25771 [Quercus suber]
MPALLLQRRTCALDRWGTYVTRIEANGKAGSLLDFLRHPGGVVERKIGCRCRSRTLAYAVASGWCERIELLGTRSTCLAWGERSRDW